jgi:hypothetical protein
MGLLVEFENLLIDEFIVEETVEGGVLKTSRLSLGLSCT